MCYPTATALALMPLVEAKALRESHVIVDGKSGASGADAPPVRILLLLRHPIISMPTRPTVIAMSWK